MKRIMALALMALLLCAAALAESTLIGDMVVVNCQEWVSLRAEPSTESDRLAKVPLGAVVTACREAENGFIRCDYDGLRGYIRADLLARQEAEATTSPAQVPVQAPAGEGNSDGQLDTVVEDVHITAVRSYGGNGTVETLTVTCAGADGTVLWTRDIHAEPTELTCTAAFIGGTAASPRLMLYTNERGLMCCDIRTGEQYWQLTPEDVDLGASLSYALAADGTMYIGGYYGPDPVVIDMAGNVLWRASAGSDEIYWLYELKIQDGCLAAHYDQLIEGNPGWVYYGFDGQTLGIERD